jgi:hypothetical protein
MPTVSATETVFQRIPRRTAYSLLGAALAVGAPAGLLLVRFASGGGGSFSWMEREIASDWRPPSLSGW